MATPKQTRVASLLSENPRKSVSSAMREAGYSKRSAEKPQELTRSKGWHELMDDYLPDETLFQAHRMLLQSRDWRARSAALGMAYRLKGKYGLPGPKEHDPIDDMTFEELEAQAEAKRHIVERYKKYAKDEHSH